MDIKTQISILSELRVAEEFTKLGYSIFQQMSGKEPFDMVVSKNGKLFRVSVKSVWKKKTSGVYSAELRRIRSNKTKNVIHPFDSESCDILCVYLHDINEVLAFNVKSVKLKNIIQIRETRMKKTNHDKFPFLISDHKINNLESCQSGLSGQS